MSQLLQEQSESLGYERWRATTAVLMVMSMATLMRSFLLVKLLLVGVFIAVSITHIALGRLRLIVHRRLVWFYIVISLTALFWALIGLFHPDNQLQGILDSLKLYFIWSIAFVILYTLLKAGTSIVIFHRAMVISGILIPLINIVTLFDRIGGVGIVPGRLQEELAITIGVGHGYMQFSSSNIISMFVIAPYLLCLQFRADADGPNSLLTKVSLIMSLVFVALSGRRTLWLAVVLTPCMILFLSSVTGNVRLMKAGVRRMLFVCVTLTVLGLGSLIVTSGSGEKAAAIKGIQQALSSEDERTYQAPYLIDGYLQSPVFGAGFGANAGIVRSEESPWMYELTYHQLLFNIGSFGVAVLGTLMSLYLAKVILLLRQFKDQSAVPFALVIALLCLLLGAYSNPYLAGFDSIFFVGMLPYLSTFRCGFTSSISSRTESLAPCL